MRVPAASKKTREQRESAARAPLRWLAIGELLCLLSHVAAVLFPALAALAIYSATGGGGGRRGKEKPRKRGRRDDDDDDDD